VEIERRRAILGLLKHVRPWIDPRSRRFLLPLTIGCFAAFLWPLAADVSSAWFFAVPWIIRWSLAQAAIVAGIVAGLVQLWVVYPSDVWPSASDLRPGTTTSRWMPWLLRFAVASLAIPMLENPDGLGFADWDFVLDKFEAVRRTILIWGQFPWWNPWCRGGFPLAAEPQIGAMSIATPMVLAMGTPIGLRVAAILCVWIAVEGAYRLGWLWFREPWAAAAVALVYGLNGAVSVSLAVGYIIAMSYGSLPWLAYHAFRIGEGFRHGIGLGFWMAFTLMNGLQYLSLYAVLLVAAVWLRALRVQPRGQRGELLRHTMGAVGLFLVISGWRLATVYLVLLDDRREAMTLWDESVTAIWRHLLVRPGIDWPATSGRHWDWYVSVTSYVGPAVVLLAVMSLARGWRWWHTLVAITGWLAIGSRHWYQPSYWLADWPFVGSAHVVTRWRFVAMLGIGLAAGSVLARWRASGQWARATLAAAAVLVIAADFLALASGQVALAFSVTPDRRWFPDPPVREIVNLGDGIGYPCVLRGYGVIRGYEPMLGYRRDAPTLRRPREDPSYRGEAWTDEGGIRPVSWSPNRLIFQVRPGQEVFINQNPGSWWLVNGRRGFEGRRCAEPMLPFAVKADGTGRLELRIDPPGLKTGIILHGIGAMLLASAASLRRRVVVLKQTRSGGPSVPSPIFPGA
jgi:hypothetical protein